MSETWNGCGDGWLGGGNSSSSEEEEFEIMRPDKNGWSDWIHPLPGYLLRCCECGLVHELQVAIIEAHSAVSVTNEGEDAEHVVVFRMRRSASGMETRSATDPQGRGPKGDSPTAESGDAHD